MKVIFESDSKNNIILEGESYHYLIVKGVRTSKKKFVCAFDGELSRMQDGERHTIADLLIRHIQTNGPFYLDPNTMPRTAAPKKRIEEVLYSLYYQKPLNTSGLKIKIANRKRISFTSYGFMPADEAELFQRYTVIGLTKNNIRSAEQETYVHTNGVFYHGPAFSADGNVVSFNGIVGTCKGEAFFTDYDAGLFSLLQKISAWDISHRGALQAKVGGSKTPFSTIVWAWHHGLISDSIEADKAILAAHRYYSTLGLEVDHLTESKSNNCLYALALVHRDINISLGARRTSIKEPFYFYTVYSHKVNKLLVKCGFDDGKQHYERQFAFDLPTSKNDTAYRECFNAFKGKAKAAGCLTTEPEKDNLVCYWADPCRAGSEGDPHIALLEAPLNRFDEYIDGAFDNMPLE